MPRPERSHGFRPGRGGDHFGGMTVCRRRIFSDFCEEMLERYRDNEKVMHIGGTNFQDGIMRGRRKLLFFRLYKYLGLGIMAEGMALFPA